MTDLNNSGGCACLLLHELMHKNGIGVIKVDSKDKDAYNAAVKANEPNENYMIYMAQALLKALCRGYGVTDWHQLTKPEGR